MGILSFNRLQSRDPKLPMYKEVSSSSSRPLRSPTKERYSDSESPTDESDDDLSDDSSPESSPGSSRRSSSSAAAHMIPKKKRKAASPPRRPPVRRYLYRLPNRVVRYLCLAMISTIVIFIFVLVRASQLENQRVAEGKVPEPKPVPAQWEHFEFLRRYYGGVKTVSPLNDNTPEYPRLEDEPPFNASQVQQHQQEKPQEKPPKKEKTEKRELVSESIKFRAVPESKPFEVHPTAALPKSEDHINECFLDSKKKLKAPSLRYLDGRPNGFPDNILGSYELLSLPEDICFDRFGRYGPYGYGYSIREGGLGVGETGDREGIEAVWKTVREVDYRSINWAEAQRQCYKSNAQRYKPLEVRPALPHGFYIGDGIKATGIHARETTKEEGKKLKTVKPTEDKDTPTEDKAETTEDAPKGEYGRTAIVLRCWDEFPWKEEDILNLRALISELSLASGGRYDVHLLVQVRNDAKHPVWADDDEYRNHINETVPEEFRGMATLWSVTQMLAVYQGVHDLWTRGPDLPVHGSYRGLQMAMQHFAYNHPEYDHFWQWEMDIRYTGHYLDLLTKLETWTTAQPRKGLWERNARFYMPYVHGSWEDFKQMARVQTEHGILGTDNIFEKIPGAAKSKPNNQPTKNTRAEHSIWGPERPLDKNDWLNPEHDDVPPTSYEKDKYVWGVGEEADLITLSPIFDPDGTSWKLADDITGYNETDGIGKPPRRAQIITASRMSRRLLVTMHKETAFLKHHAFPEMWPATVSLHHGYKAVFAPHPVFVDRAWPPEYMARVLNGGKNGASGGARTSVYGDREHNMRGLTWFYNAGFSANLYKRWMGLKVNNDGGEQFEMTVDESMDDLTVGSMKGGEGRMCLPPMLLHPVKEVELPVQARDGAADVLSESDPSA
ncbi:hypothetical protein QBC38DRAFT_123652 [Podospora fimiseda]|uniref:Uncharacterized protein n=1 Tax=Podospora fimiseda TaxID=252190 RepID=A0AAN7BTE8_9PEZI|nr:hypothetical protein QBC38DRAFT_123652 [Podospora fimiseda]